MSEPLILGPGEGRRFPTTQPSVTVKTDAATAPFAFFESEPPPGILVAPPHLHHAYTESFYVLAGEIEFRVADRTVHDGPGGFIHVPSGVVHGFYNPGPNQAKMLIVVYPADGLGLVEEVLALTYTSAGAPDPVAIGAIFATYNSELIHST